MAPGASYKAICQRFKGAKTIQVDAAGGLLIDRAAGMIRQHNPEAYQKVNSARHEVKAACVVSCNRKMSFHLGVYGGRFNQ
jgi:hypothetical protein